MSGTTPKGWPYVTPEDHPLEYPAWSQQFALAIDAAAASLASATGAGLTLTTTDQVAATIAAANAGNPSPRPRIAVCVYAVHVANSTANNGVIASLQVRDAANAATLASVFAQVNPINYSTSPVLILPFVMAASTNYVVRSLIKSTVGQATVAADPASHVLHRILLP